MSDDTTTGGGGEASGKGAVEARAILDDDDFRTLVTGGEVVKTDTLRNVTVRLILSDIGFDRMYKHLDAAWNAAKFHHGVEPLRGRDERR